MINSKKDGPAGGKRAIKGNDQASLLEKRGYRIIHAINSEKAEKIMQKRQNPEILRMEDIPVVFLFSHTEPDVVAKNERITSYGYVVRNSNITVLATSIKKAP